MSCIQIPISGFSPLSRSAPARRRRLDGPSVVRCHFQESEGEDPPESLFMRELRRRGMAPMTPIVLPSMPEESGMVLLELELLEGLEIEVQIEKEGLARMTRRMKRAAAWEEFDGGMAGERRELDDEQLEGFIPRAKLLLTIGMYFLGSGPLIMITFTFFAALYLISELYQSIYRIFLQMVNTRSIRGLNILGRVSCMMLARCRYHLHLVEIHMLLEDERISQMARHMNWI